MFKKIALAVAAIFVLVALTACGGVEQKWDGEWKADGFAATVQGQNIEIHIVTKDKATDALYWKGTFATASTTVKDENVTSAADRAVMDKAIFASQDATKTFTVKDGKISFPMSMMGVKRTVELSK